ncbi:hypothetical protein AGMMS5026_06070 [Endomicrobiia bacterium]|nr:hypothetical protein AGMMS49523_09760 [Endomicrobiia bacterium]GHT10617.1 hypothetical protein AGMMS49532_10580 [Endomicrobiia bacterium]GHT13009.1 hypothetical protein AGMMS49571_06000 [Endomicrobiia bacterium]GHT18611.1 hypothetical protein AGMMS49929_00630 [Endomicrobiia bacterium]GHT29142.1 hypothetical protein AGMMS49995_11100 [Endomicrobiia bacterium]
MFKFCFSLFVLVLASGCNSKSMLKLAGAVESLNKDLVEANKVLAKSNVDLSNSVTRSMNAIRKLVDVQEKEAERKAKKDAEKKAKEEAKKNRSWYEKLVD